MAEYKYKGREREYQREWARNLRLTDPEKAKERARKSRQKRKLNPNYQPKRKAWDFAAGIRRRYGLTVEQYNALLIKQDGKCAICREVFIPTKAHPRLSVDHKHGTKIVRGLLCHRCNIGLGAFRDNSEYLLNAYAYLQKKIQLEKG